MTSFSNPCSGTVELNVIGVYEATTGGHGGPPGKITVDIQRTQAMVLVLSSYEPVDWTVNAVSGAQIQEVILNGYHPQTVSGLVFGIPVTTRSGPGNYLSACGYAWPSSTGGCNTPLLVSNAESLTQLQLTSFIGCYQANSFSLGP